METFVAMIQEHKTTYIHEILILITYVQKLPINTHADTSSGARILNFSQSLHLHPYFVYASSKGPVKPQSMFRLT